MMNVMKTGIGKGILFVTTLAAIAVTLGLILLASFCYKNGFYEGEDPRTDGAYFDQVMENACEKYVIEYQKEYCQDTLHGESSIEQMDFPDNIKYWILDEDGEVLSGNKNLKEMEKKEGVTLYTRYVLVIPEWGYFSEFMDRESMLEVKEECENEFETDEEECEVYTYQGYFEGGAPDSDLYQLTLEVYQDRNYIIPAGIVSGAIALAGYILLLIVAGRRPKEEKIYPGIDHKIPYDLFFFILTGVTILLCAISIFTVDETLMYNSGTQFRQILGYGIFMLLLCTTAFLWFSCSTAVRIKEKSLLKNTVIAGIFRFLLKPFRKMGNIVKEFFSQSSVFQTLLLCFLAVSVFEFIIVVTGERAVFMTGRGGFLTIAWFAGRIIRFLLLCAVAVSLQTLLKTEEALAEGDFHFKADIKKLFGPLKRNGEHLNHISDGMNQAVEEQLKSERMKTELITNVSHDLKTPLTSLINYADLLGKEPSDNPKIGEYAEVVLRQSDRLKRLIEDLVEASKASTGNLEVSMAPCDARMFLSQAAGEYEEKLEAAHLQPIVKNEEEPVKIMADGRRMLRIFDNLMNNICKYAKEDTRVYLSLECQGKEAVITFKNISRNELDMKPEELMERFVRGDRSRNTEGNGLGLSIARSLTELQQGKMEIAIDGDLFKVQLIFHIAE